MYPLAFFNLGRALAKEKRAFFDVLIESETPRGRMLNKLIGRENVEEALGDTAEALTGVDVEGDDLVKDMRGMLMMGRGKAPPATAPQKKKVVLDPNMPVGATLANAFLKKSVYLGNQTPGKTTARERTKEEAIQKGNKPRPDSLEAYMRQDAGNDEPQPNESFGPEVVGRGKEAPETKRDADSPADLAYQSDRDEWLDIILS